MKKIISILLILISLPILSNSDKDISEIIKNIKINYSKVETFEANFEQNFYHNAYKREKKSKGSVVFKKDIKMKWNYISPERKYVISNGKTLWIYEPENEQVFRSQMGNSELENISKFLFGDVDLLKKYNITIGKKSDETKDLSLVLIPKSKETSYKKIILFFDTNYQLKATEIIDNFSNINKITYKNIVKNRSIDDTFFNFVVPDDVEIIEQDIK